MMIEMLACCRGFPLEINNGVWIVDLRLIAYCHTALVLNVERCLLRLGEELRWELSQFGYILMN
jgi:hypothetical protein